MVAHRAIDLRRSSGAEVFQYSPDVTVSVIKECFHVFILKYMYNVEISNWNGVNASKYFYFIYIFNQMYPKGFYGLKIFQYIKNVYSVFVSWKQGEFK